MQAFRLISCIVKRAIIFSYFLFELFFSRRDVKQEIHLMLREQKRR